MTEILFVTASGTDTHFDDKCRKLAKAFGVEIDMRYLDLSFRLFDNVKKYALTVEGSSEDVERYRKNLHHAGVETIEVA